MSVAVIAMMACAVACGNNSKKAEEAVEEAVEAAENCCGADSTCCQVEVVEEVVVAE